MEAGIELLAAALDPHVGVRVKRIGDNLDEAVTGAKFGALFATDLGSVAPLLACAGIYRPGIVRGDAAAPGGCHPDGPRRGARSLDGHDDLAETEAGSGRAHRHRSWAGKTRLIRAMLYGVSSVDPCSFGTTAALLVGARADLRCGLIRP